MKNWIPIIVLLAIVVAARGAYQRFFTGVEVLAVRAEIGEIRQFIEERGKTRLPKEYLVTMPYDARIEPIVLREGDPVKQGQAVASIVRRDRDLHVERMQATLDRIKASIRENDDDQVEQISLKQAVNFVVSMKEAVRAASARVRSGKEKFLYAMKNRERTEKLYKSGAKTEDDFDLAKLQQVETEVEYSQDQLVYSAMLALESVTDLMPTLVRQMIQRKQLAHDVLQQELAEAQTKFTQTQIDHQRGALVSPVEGVVLERNVHNERALSAGTVLMKVGRLEDLEIEAEVLTQDAVRIQKGDRVEVYGASIGTESAQATVDRVFPAGFTKVSSLGVEQQRVLVIIRLPEAELLRLKKTRNLGVDYRVWVRIITKEKAETVVVPRSAIFRNAKGRWNVFVIEAGVARLQAVTLGLTNDDHVEITEGLVRDDMVVLAPESSLTDGTRVTSVVDE